MAKLGEGMLFSVEQAFVGRDKIQAALKMPVGGACVKVVIRYVALTEDRCTKVSVTIRVQNNLLVQKVKQCFSQR